MAFVRIVALLCVPAAVSAEPVEPVGIGNLDVERPSANVGAEAWVSTSGQRAGTVRSLVSSVGVTLEAGMQGEVNDPEHESYEAWLTALTEPAARPKQYGASARVDAQLLGRGGAVGDDLPSAIVDQTAELHGCGWRVEQWLGYQRAVSFSAPFWRSGRGLLEIGTAVETAPLWAIGAGKRGFYAFRGRVGYAELAARMNGGWVDAHYDLDVDIAVGAGGHGAALAGGAVRGDGAEQCAPHVGSHRLSGCVDVRSVVVR